jgi:Family of unknown function (DUF6491)
MRRWIMRAQLLQAILIGVMLSGGYGYAYSQASPDPEAAGLPGTAGCFRVRDVRGWTVLDDSTLIVQAPRARNAYLVKLFRPVQGLSFQTRLGFQDVEHNGRICDRSRDNLLVRDFTPPRIPIVAVRQLTVSEQSRLLASAGRGASSHTSPR